MDIEDKKCEPLVLFFNSIGLKTRYCCGGHNQYQSFWIMFDDEVKDADIHKFMSKLHKGSNGFGQFYKWDRYDFFGALLSNWMYVISADWINVAKKNDYIPEEGDLKIFKRVYGI